MTLNRHTAGETHHLALTAVENAHPAGIGKTIEQQYAAARGRAPRGGPGAVSNRGPGRMAAVVAAAIVLGTAACAGGTQAKKSAAADVAATASQSSPAAGPASDAPTTSPTSDASASSPSLSGGVPGTAAGTSAAQAPATTTHPADLAATHKPTAPPPADYTVSATAKLLSDQAVSCASTPLPMVSLEVDFTVTGTLPAGGVTVDYSWDSEYGTNQTRVLSNLKLPVSKPGTYRMPYTIRFDQASGGFELFWVSWTAPGKSGTYPPNHNPIMVRCLMP